MQEPQNATNTSPSPMPAIPTILQKECCNYYQAPCIVKQDKESEWHDDDTIQKNAAGKFYRGLCIGHIFRKTIKISENTIIIINVIMEIMTLFKRNIRKKGKKKKT